MINIFLNYWDQMAVITINILIYIFLVLPYGTVCTYQQSIWSFLALSACMYKSYFAPPCCFIVPMMRLTHTCYIHKVAFFILCKAKFIEFETLLRLKYFSIFKASRISVHSCYNCAPAPLALCSIYFKVNGTERSISFTRTGN